MNKIIQRVAFFVLIFLVILSSSCKTIKYIPEDLRFKQRKHSHIRTMSLHMLRIYRVNRVRFKGNDIYDVKTNPGMKTVYVRYVGGVQPLLDRRPGDLHSSHRTFFYTYKPQKKKIRFRALPGKSHFIQYIAHPDKPMTVWQNSHDYISHLREKPVFKKDISRNRTMTVRRTVKGSSDYILKRFLNELLLQEYLHNLIGGWSIQPMFRPVKNRIIVNLSGIGEKPLDNEVIGSYEFVRTRGNSVQIVMRTKRHFHKKFADYMKEVFVRFDPSYRVNVYK